MALSRHLEDKSALYFNRFRPFVRMPRQASKGEGEDRTRIKEKVEINVRENKELQSHPIKHVRIQFLLICSPQNRPSYKQTKKMNSLFFLQINILFLTLKSNHY